MIKQLITYKKWPLSISARDGELTNKEQFTYASILEDSLGIIQFQPYIEPNNIYTKQHNNSIGKVWENHNYKFAEFISRNIMLNYNIVEVGGGTGKLFNLLNDSIPNISSYTIIDINPQIDNTSKNLYIVQREFETSLVNSNDVVISSHFLEHVINIHEFLINLNKTNTSQHLFSIPNLVEYAKNNYASTISLEHPTYLTENLLEYILSKTGWVIVAKEYYNKHSIFYNIKPKNNNNNNNNTSDVPLNTNSNNYIYYMLTYLLDRIKQVDMTGEKFYIYGANYLLYYFMNFSKYGIENIIGVLDGDISKQGQRMYGTNVKIYNPSDIPEYSNVLLEMGPYNEEIKNKYNIKCI